MLGLVSLLGYLFTLSPTVALWDCGEFIAAAHTLGIPHPPGTPFYMLVGKFFELLVPLGGIAWRYNLLSALASVGVCLFVMEIAMILLAKAGVQSKWKIPAAFVGSSILAFSDTFWFNAVEAEVYGLSMLQFVAGIWMIFRWEQAEVGWSRDRWLVLYVFTTFLGTGLHMYSLLSLPLVWIFVGVKSGYIKGGWSIWGLLGCAGMSALVLFYNPLAIEHVAFLVSVLIIVLVFLLWAVQRNELNNIPYWLLGLLLFSVIFFTFDLLVAWAIWCVVVAMCSLGKPITLERIWIIGIVLLGAVALLVFLPQDKLGTGGWVLCGAGLLQAVWLLRKKSCNGNHKSLLLWILLVAGLGYSVQLYLPVRSALNPVIDENNPETWENFRATLERKQYQSDGMLQRAFVRRGEFVHQMGFHPRIGYLGYHLQQFLPAPLGAQSPANLTLIREKGVWGILHFLHRVFWQMVLVIVLLVIWQWRKKHEVALIAALFAMSSLGLIFYMNFADGTRSDSGHVLRWKRAMQALSEEAKQRDIYPLPPLMPLGSLQHSMQNLEMLPDKQQTAFLQSTEGKYARYWAQWLGVARQLGKNLPRLPGPVHLEVRERDYFYAPAFILYAILIAFCLGLGLQKMGSASWVERQDKYIRIVLSLIWILPFISHYPVHNRSGDFVAWDFAYNILNSVPSQGVVFTNGDNDTFPLWYLQLVEGVRKDVTVINLALSNLPWYREQIRKHYPHIKHALGEEEILRRAFIREAPPPWMQTNVQNALWRPTHADLFVLGIALANDWDINPLCFVFTTTEQEMIGLAPYAPYTGLVRQVGLEDSVAANLKVENLLHRYRYTGLESGNWRWQDGAARVVASYRHLVQIALGLPDLTRENRAALHRIQTRLFIGE